MIYSKRFIYETQYEYAGSNQNGDRYKVGNEKRVTVVKMTASANCAEDLFNLVILSDQLGMPIKWDSQSSPQEAWIEIRTV